jgi:hypothetical protein
VYRVQPVSGRDEDTTDFPAPVEWVSAAHVPTDVDPRGRKSTGLRVGVVQVYGINAQLDDLGRANLMQLGISLPLPAHEKFLRFQVVASRYGLELGERSG